jgi:hypothetical protein
MRWRHIASSTVDYGDNFKDKNLTFKNLVIIAQKCAISVQLKDMKLNSMEYIVD